MALFTGIVLIHVIGFIIAVFAAIYTYFQWIFRTWKRKNIPFFEPSFPDGNRQPFRKAVPFGEEVFHIVKRAKQKGEKSMFISSSPKFFSSC